MATARSASEIERDSQYLYARLYAPCCWAQTLDVHYSPVVNDLRAHIRERLESGISRDDIVASLVNRYGARIVAAQPQTSTATLMFAGAALLGSFPLLFLLQRRRHLRHRETEPDAQASPDPSLLPVALQDKLDEELDKLE
jgi:cytochrome c-type biogenesis protein CcmH